MCRRCCLLLLLLFALCPAALAQTGLSLKTGEVRGFDDNVITLASPVEGMAVLSLTDSRDRLLRTWTAEVAAGENRLVWDGLAEGGQPLDPGNYTLSVFLAGREATTQVQVKKALPALLYALPSGDTLYLGGGEAWFADVQLTRPATLVFEVTPRDDPDRVVFRERKKLSAGHVRYNWRGGKLAPGDYLLRFSVKDGAGEPVVCPVTLVADAVPAFPVEVTGSLMPASLSDADVWAAMMQPSVVCDLRNSTDHQPVYAGPGTRTEVLGTLHGRSQAVEVLGFSGREWARIAAWNHESGSRIEGYVPRRVLTVVTPNPEYGILINKQDQTLTVYRRGQRLGTVPVSTGLMAEDRLIRETAAGAFLTMERISAFDDSGYHYVYPIRYDGGNLLHAIGYKSVKGTPDYTAQLDTLGQKASHGCVRVSTQPGEGGISAWWLWTHIPYHTRVLILDDPEQRQARAEELGVTLPEAAQTAQKQPLRTLSGTAPDTGDVLTLTFGGDAVLGVREAWWKRDDALPAYLERYGLEWPFSGLKTFFASDDMTFINLECVLKADRGGEQTGKMYRFRGLPSWTQALLAGSVEQVNIANNHYIDYDAAGKKSTRQALTAAGMPFSGYTFTYIWEKDGHRIGFAGCRETMWKRSPGLIAGEVQALREAGCEVVIYSCHWGNEYEDAHNATQLEMAREAAAAGADIVVGTHPHVVQGVAEMDGTVVLWSLGNLMFGGTLDLSTYDAAIARATLTFENGRYAGVTIEMIPILTSGRAAEGVNDFHPVPAGGEDRTRILQKIQADTDFVLDGPVWFPR